MMLLFSICLIVGAVLDSFLGTFTFNHLLLVMAGLIILVVDLVGSKIRFFRGIGKSSLSIIVLVVVTVMIIGISSSRAPVAKETTDVLKKAEKVLDDKGYKAAIKVLEDSNTDSGWNKLVTLKIAEIYMAEEMFAEAASTYSTLVTNLPDDLEMRSLFAKALFKSQDYNGALREVQYIAKINPEYSEAYVIMGDVYAGLNDLFREIYFYKIAVGLDGKSIDNRIHLAEAYGLSHSSKEAVEQYEIAKKLAKSFEDKNLIYESYLRFANADSEQSR